MRLGREVVFIDDAMLFPTHVSLISQSKASRTMAAVAQGGPRGPPRRSLGLLLFFALLLFFLVVGFPTERRGRCGSPLCSCARERGEGGGQ